MLVLAGDGVAFKMYSGNLTYHSDVFADMINAAKEAQPTSSHRTPEMEGCEVALDLPEPGADLGIVFDIMIGKR